MGNTAVRSQMDIRICLRVRERRDVDLILGQGAFSAGWHAHTLTQPGAFLISAPEHTTPHRARAYLITDQHITRHTTTGSGRTPPGPSERPQTAEPATADVEHPASPETALWAALRRAGPHGVSVTDLRAQTGMSRPTLYRHLRAHAQAGRVVQTTRGYWRAVTPQHTPPSRPPSGPTRHRRRHGTPDAHPAVTVRNRKWRSGPSRPTRAPARVGPPTRRETRQRDNHAESPRRGRRIRVRGAPRRDLDLHLVARALLMISEDLTQEQQGPGESARAANPRAGPE
jgi:AcrR family transcriptional regulator